MIEIDEVLTRARKAKSALDKQQEEIDSLNDRLDGMLSKAQSNSTKIREIKEIISQLSDVQVESDATPTQANSSPSDGEDVGETVSKSQKRRTQEVDSVPNDVSVATVEDEVESSEAIPSLSDTPLAEDDEVQEEDELLVPFSEDDDTLDDFDNIDFG
jgi:hypothetical protein